MLKVGGTLFPIVARFVFFGTAFGLVGALGLLPPEETREQPLGLLLGQHQSCVRCLAFAPDGQTLATVGGFSDSASEIKLWDVPTATERATFRGSPSGVKAVAFAPDGRTLATVSGDQIVTLWDVAAGRERASVPAQLSKSLRIVIASDGRTLAVTGWDGNPGSVRLWRIPPDPERKLVATSALAAFSADGHRLTLWQLATESERTVAGPVHEPISSTFGTFSEPQAVQIKDIPLGQEMYTLRADQNYVWALAFSPDGQTLATGGFDESVRLWDVGTGQERATLRGHTDQVGAIAFAPDGKVLASGSHDTTVRVWSAATGEELVNFHGHTGTVTCVAFDPTGQWIASGSHDRTVRLWPTARVQ